MSAPPICPACRVPMIVAGRTTHYYQCPKCGATEEAAMSARECQKCGGGTTMVRRCDYCNRTGKVWPSVPGETAAEFDGLDPRGTDRPDLEAMIYETAIESRGSRVRLIYQPIESEAKP